MPEAPMARDGSTKPSRGCRCPASSPASAWSPKDNRGRLHWSLVATTDSTAALEWLLASDEPAIGYLARREILGDRVEPDSEAILAGPIASALLSGQKPTAASAAIPARSGRAPTGDWPHSWSWVCLAAAGMKCHSRQRRDATFASMKRTAAARSCSRRLAALS